MISINRIGNKVFMSREYAGGVDRACLIDTQDGVVFYGNEDMLKVYNGTRRGLIDDDKLSALYKSIEGGVKPKD